MKRVVVAVVTLVTALNAFAGIEFTSKVSDKRDRTISTSKAWIDGDNAKITYDGKDSKSGSYMLSTDGGQTIYMVNPKEKSYLKVDVDQLASQVGNFMNAAGGFMKLEFKDPKFKTTLNERGPEMFGLPTRHLKTETSYTVVATVFGKKNISHISRKDEIWLTDKLHDKALEIWSQQRKIRTGNENIDKVISAESSRIKGVPLKIISVTSTRESNGRERVEKSTTEITSLHKKKIPAATFKLPRNYENKNEEVKAGLQAIKSELIKDAGDNAAEDTGKAVNSLLNGLFGGGK